MGEDLRIRYTVVDDIDFKPMWEATASVIMNPTNVVEDFIAKIRENIPSLQKYDGQSFRVLKIQKPVPPVIDADTQEISEQHRKEEPLSLGPILQRLRERTREAKKTELTNEYVKVLSEVSQLQNNFKDEDKWLLSAILVRLTTPEEKLEKGLKWPLEPGTAFRLKNLFSIIHGDPPSETSGHRGANLRAYALMDRPANRYTLPVALFDKNLALLQYMLENLGVPFGSNKAKQLFPNEITFYSAADKFISVAIRDYPSNFWGQSQVGVQTKYKVANVGRNASTKFDGAYVTTIKTGKNSPITRVIVEVKNTAYQGDAVSQMTKGFAEEVYGFKDKNYFESTYFPKIFIALNGHKLEISVAVCLETVVVNEILSLDIRDNLFRSELKQKLARVAVALKICSAQLDEYYSELKVGKMSYFPSPTLEPLDTSQLLMQDALEGFKIVGHLGRDNDEAPVGRKDQPEPADMRHNLFLTTYLGAASDPTQLVVVKLVKRYGQPAHECLAREEFELAPKLIRCQPVIGNLIVVVMERARGHPLGDPVLTPNLNPSNKLSVFEGLKRAISALECDGLVHGDLRAPNIMVDDSNPEMVSVKVIDFDWAAKHDEGFYPDTINIDELKNQWHSDVGPMKKMKLEHDKFAVFNVLRPKYLDI